MTDVENMFDLNRFHHQQDSHKILLYFPFGFLFLLLRLVIAMISLPILIFLPASSKQRSYIIKVIRLVFGVKIKVLMENKDENAKLIMCNHTSILDHLVVESAFPCKQMNMCSHFSDWTIPALFFHYGQHSHNSPMSLLQHCSESDTLVCVFPEKTTTNGKHGLLRFDPVLFDSASLIQPVSIEISNTSFISISPSVIGSSSWGDLLWLLFIPYTSFTLRALPSMLREDNESAESFSRRVQIAVASSLGIRATELTAADKAEYQKQIVAGTIHRSFSSHVPAERQRSDINKMAMQVRDILPDVPCSVILKDLGTTNSVDDTILRILEGKVRFVPDSISSSSHSAEKQSSSHSSDSSSSSSIRTQSQVQPSEIGAKTFGKTPKERMLSYEERKSALIKNAKLHYFKMHGLNC